MKHSIRLVAGLCLTLASCGTARNAWRLEAENDSTTVTFSGDTVTLSSPQGATLWWKKRLSGNVEISYRARVLDKPRVSDLNCFWMASSCGVGTGRFLEQYRMSLYYVGMGGNHNSTTRFRRYNGDARGVDSLQYRPAIIQEYTDAPHLLEGNRWYDILLRCKEGRTQYCVDGQVWVDYTDPQPLTSGWFGLRTTWATVQLTGFKVKHLP